MYRALSLFQSLSFFVALLSYFFLVKHTDTVRNFTGESDGFLSSAKMIEFILDKNVASQLFRKPEDFVEQLTLFTDAVLKYRQGKHEDKECVEFLKDIAINKDPHFFLIIDL